MIVIFYEMSREYSSSVLVIRESVSDTQGGKMTTNISAPSDPIAAHNDGIDVSFAGIAPMFILPSRLVTSGHAW